MKTKHALSLVIATAFFSANAAFSQTWQQHKATFQLTIQYMGETVVKGSPTSDVFSQSFVTEKISNKEILTALLDIVGEQMGGSITGWSINAITDPDGEFTYYVLSKKGAELINISEGLFANYDEEENIYVYSGKDDFVKEVYNEKGDLTGIGYVEINFPDFELFTEGHIVAKYSYIDSSAGPSGYSLLGASIKSLAGITDNEDSFGVVTGSFSVSKGVNLDGNPFMMR